MKTVRNVIVIIAIAAVAFIGSYFWVSRPPAKPVVTPPTAPTVSVVTPVVEKGEETFVSKEVKVPEGKDALQVAIEHLLVTRDSPFPSGTRLLGSTEKGSLVTLDFSKELVRNFQGGSSEEAALLNSLKKTIAQFPEISKLQITVEGKKVDSIGEHIDISGPIDIR